MGEKDEKTGISMGPLFAEKGPCIALDRSTYR